MQDILTRLDSFENINLHQKDLSKNTKDFDQANTADDDEDLGDHQHHLDIPQLFYHPLFDSDFLSFNHIIDHRTNQLYDHQILVPSSRLFLFNKILRI